MVVAVVVMGEPWVVLVVQVVLVVLILLVALETLLQQILLKDNLEGTAVPVQVVAEAVHYALDKPVQVLAVVMAVMEQ